MIQFLDCTLRDGGYYNSWNFNPELIVDYLKSMAALPVDMVEIGFRLMPDSGGKFKGGCAFCTDNYIRALNFPQNGLKLAVMINGADLTKYQAGPAEAVKRLFGPSGESPLDMVRVAVHVHKAEETLPAINTLHEMGYKTTINLMQIAGLSQKDIRNLAKVCSEYPIDVLYFADSLGSMVQDDINSTVDALRAHWQGELGFHAHNNMEWALANCIRAVEQGVNWIDSTVLGMGRGPGNCRTEYLAIEFETRFGRKMNHTPLLELIDKHFRPMQQLYRWGPNAYYYMAGKYGIHPTYIQEMMGDARYDGEDILAVINHLKKAGGKHYSLGTLESARNFYSGDPRGTWNPADVINGRDVLIIGTGPGVSTHRTALEQFIRLTNPYVMALNTQTSISPELINVRLACHPVRLLADYEQHAMLPQPLVTPASMLPANVQNSLEGKTLFDFGIRVKPETFDFFENYCIMPSSMVVTYALAVATSGQARQIMLAGFDGYGPEDPRNMEMNNLIELYNKHERALPIVAITPTKYQMHQLSVYSLLA